MTDKSKALQICLCQFDIIWENTEANLRKLDALFQEYDLTETDILVLPEMFHSGFTMSVESEAQNMDGEVVHWMRSKADQLQVAICGSVIVKEKEHYYNRFLWITLGDSSILSYDKRHLFRLAGEDGYYANGSDKLLIEYDGWRIQPFICYDLRFPVWCRNTERADLQIYVANFPASRTGAWDTLLRARAIENQCYVVGVNRVGKDGKNIDYIGHSAAIDYNGDCLVGPIEGEQIANTILKQDPLLIYRRAYPFLGDGE